MKVVLVFLLKLEWELMGNEGLYESFVDKLMDYVCDMVKYMNVYLLLL